MYQLTKEDESLNEEMWLEIMEILATFGTIGEALASIGRLTLPVFARRRVAFTRIFVEEEERNESEKRRRKYDWNS